MIVIVSPGASAAGAAAVGESPAEFIRILGGQGLEVIGSAATLSQKAIYFRQMLRQDFDLPDMCRFVLGPYWRVASHRQRREFRGFFEEHLLHFYGERFAQYGGESFRVTGTRIDPAGLIVTSQIIRSLGPPIGVDWRLSIRDGLYKVSDVVVDGVSMASTQRSEVSAIIQRNGGQLAGLLTTIRD
jgi:phospholipid transport system substrate-binding protein